ncbi:MAG: hypothetical protein HQM10_13090 [Candidatus Riflebacteria bacterium]|nr:hypothetical protein [Candidatus Riflebacteria bacterium]
MYSRKIFQGLILGLLAAVIFSGTCYSQTIKQVFDHQLLVNQPSQSWEHRVDLPDQYAQQGLIFVKRNLKIVLPCFLVVEREELNANYYYVKVRLPKVLPESKRGIVEVELSIGNTVPVTPDLNPPTELSLSQHTAARKPAFLWKGDSVYSAVTLYDLDEGQTIFERVVDNKKRVCLFDEPYFLPLHRYIWAVKQVDETGKESAETQARFRIENQNGTVVVIQD